MTDSYSEAAQGSSPPSTPEYVALWFGLVGMSLLRLVGVLVAIGVSRDWDWRLRGSEA
jgi:hypothetical protein